MYMCGKIFIIIGVNQLLILELHQIYICTYLIHMISKYVYRQEHNEELLISQTVQ